MGQLIDIKTICSRLRVGRTTLDSLRKRANFPAPALRIGKLQRWREEEIDAWLMSSSNNKKETPEAA